MEGTFESDEEALEFLAFHASYVDLDIERFPDEEAWDVGRDAIAVQLAETLRPYIEAKVRYATKRAEFSIWHRIADRDPTAKSFAAEQAALADQASSRLLSDVLAFKGDVNLTNALKTYRNLTRLERETALPED